MIEYARSNLFMLYFVERKRYYQMADVQPLRGIRYADEIVGDLSQIITPPFDVISPEAQERYYRRNPYNVIRLELGKEYPEDDSLDNRYTRAASTYAEWRLHGVLRQESAPCYYMYSQEFTYGGKNYTRTSLLARVRLEPWSERVVLPHEHTLAKLKDDRLHLLRACATNFSPIMCMYDDPQSRIRRLLANYAANPAIQVTDEVGETHSLQPITDAAQIALIQDFFAERQLYIADGHHRYETALNYRNEVLAKRKELFINDAVNFVMMALIDVDDPGFLVLPTHRMLFNLSSEMLSKLSLQPLACYFTVRELDNATTNDSLVEQLAQAADAPSFVISTPDQQLLLTINEQGRQRMAGSGHSEAWNDLDVAVAHMLVLEDLLGISAEDLTKGSYIRFTSEAKDALQAVATGQAQAALLLNPTKVRQVVDVAQADDRMPQKSTYYYPKLITGLVLNPLW
jgi:uncharacterized protein (DUF1015 family)